jgi:ferrous iron transport protein B
MGISEDNWPATVGIFTGIFAKEVVVGTLDALYSPQMAAEAAPLSDLLSAAVSSVPENLSELGDALLDPLGIAIDEKQELADAAAAQEVAVGTLGRMQQLFDGQLGAFSYLLFVLLYMPCVATIGVILKEIGAFWAVFSTAWSVVMAYSCAVLVYQAGSLATDPGTAMFWIATVGLLAAGAFAGLIRFGQRRAPPLIPIVHLD